MIHAIFWLPKYLKENYEEMEREKAVETKKKGADEKKKRISAKKSIPDVKDDMETELMTNDKK